MESNELTTAQIREALDQMIVQCDLAYDDHYRGLSARSCLYELGYEAHADQIINAIAEAGFTYCLDPHISATHFDPDNKNAVNDMVTDYPSADACYWGPDQLKSRINAIGWKFPRDKY